MGSPVLSKNPKEHEDAFAVRRRRRSEIGFVLHGLRERLDFSILQIGMPNCRLAATIAHIGEDVRSEEGGSSPNVPRFAIAEVKCFARARALALETQQEQPRPLAFLPLEDQRLPIDIP